jgi:antitoxin component of RelBE/YafQ-DinJ toxin-antitoxin module
MDATPTQRRKGRPALPERERRTAMVRARLSPAERERLDAVLAERQLTESDLVRELLAPVLTAAA